MAKTLLKITLAVSFVAGLLVGSAAGQRQTPIKNQKVRTVSIPISIFTKEELREGQMSEYVQADRLIVREDREEQSILSIRSVTEAPLSLAILIQEDLVSSFNLQLKDLAGFVKGLPRGSRVMVAYMRGGTLQIRQKFTDDLELASNSFRIVSSSSASAPRSPFESLVDALDRFDALPAGRRAVLIVSDGLDSSAGIANSSPGQSIELDRAILRAQRRSAAVFSFYVPTTLTENGEPTLVLNGQGSLNRLSEETGGRAFFQGTLAPVSFVPFFKDLRVLLYRQFLLTYMSTHMKKGYHRVEVTSTNPDVKVEHPKGYYYR